MTTERAPLLLPAVSLWRREVVRFLRQRSRILGALGTPVVFWLLLGSGLRNSFKITMVGEVPSSRDMNYLEYFFPGTLVLIVLFTAIFSTISIIEDRREGFLQAVVAAPIHRVSIVLGKVLGSSTLAIGQAMLFMLLAPWSGTPLSLPSVLALLAVLIPVAMGLSALGVLIAWPMDSTQGFHAIMNLFLIPMWMLSGALFPAAGASNWIRWIMAVNPLTYCVSAVRAALYLPIAAPPQATVSSEFAIAITIFFALLMMLAAERVVARRS